jgi:NAD(P)-dependent dehydrogenase (short-subunit alcohol dehydrogenase family)
MLNRFTGSSERKAALTRTVPLGRVGDPAEIAHAAIFLAGRLKALQSETRRMAPSG